MNTKKIIRKLLPPALKGASEEVYRKSRIAASHVRYGRPAKGLRIIAVTGTNGKTSTCNFLNDVLKSAGYTTALYTTATIEMAGERSLNRSHRTVPLTSELFNFFKRARSKKVDFVILETTSHALHQHKVWGVPIEIAVMTNLSQDHLDYHGSMERYAEAKARLFNNYLHPRHCVLNADDEWFAYYLTQASSDVTTYGKAKDSNVVIASSTQSGTSTTMRFETPQSSIIASVPVIGEFNVYNIGAVVAVCTVLAIKPDSIRRGLEAIKPVPGRMETIQTPQGVSIVVDYAHAPDALEKALKALRTKKTRRLIVVFGATGDRDTSKRPIMGEIAAQYADTIFLTDDETYTEDGNAIRRAVMEGVVKGGGREKVTEIADRYLAISQAIKKAERGDVILVAGLGHQDYRMMNDGKLAWDEVSVIKDILANDNR